MRFWSDNSAVVALINSGSSRENTLMHCLSFIMAKYNFVVSAAHIKGSHNVLADALSWNNRAYFLSHYPQAQASPTSVPLELEELIVTSQPDWTSPHWTNSPKLPTHIHFCTATIYTILHCCRTGTTPSN